jgi:hypothetical protein
MNLLKLKSVDVGVEFGDTTCLSSARRWAREAGDGRVLLGMRPVAGRVA